MKRTWGYHFNSWRYFFQAKKTGKEDTIGAIGFFLRPGLKSQYINMEIPDNKS
jgi:hypothetical protein